MPSLKVLPLVLALAGMPFAPAVALENAGPYLAGRHAQIRDDFTQAAKYLALAVAQDGASPSLLESLTGAYMSLGDFERAAATGTLFVEADESSQIVNLALLTVAAANGDWAGLRADLADGPQVGPLYDGLVAAWALIGADQPEDALAAFDAVIEDLAVRPYGIYHKALALASLGRFEEATATLETEESLQLTRRGVRAQAEMLAQQGRFDEAVAALDSGFGTDNLDPVLVQMRAALEAEEALPYTIAPDARTGVAEVTFDIANALSNEVGNTYTLLYARAVEHLRPGHIEGTLLSAALLDRLAQYDLAAATYAVIPADSPAYTTAELGRAEVLRKAGKDAAAIEVMQRLARDFPDLAVIHAALGDALRDLERFAEARVAYDDAVALFTEDQDAQWIVYFARAITEERTDNWDGAEADFRKALALSPEQPQVLNYLGYSLVERRENLDEALNMIERAAAARPDSGYIVDSLGWVFYRLGRFEDAVAPMERAVQLEPVDPVVNDHLGDVYWSVGRKLEARFQWSRALSFEENGESEEVNADRIRRKLEVGLDIVLEEEGAPSLDDAASTDL